MESEWKWSARNRALAGLAVACVVWMQVGPVTEQVFHQGVPWGTKAWQMYSGRGANVCAVTWWSLADDGSLASLARPESEGNEGRWQRSRREVMDEGARLCTVTGEEVRADAWCGRPRKRGRWAQVLASDVDLCGRP